MVCLVINCLKDIWQIRWFVRIFLNIYCINRVCMDDGIHHLFVYRIFIYIVKVPLTLNNIVLGRFFRAGGFGGPFRLRQFWKNIREKFPAESLHELLWPEVLLMTSVSFRCAYLKISYDGIKLLTHLQSLTNFTYFILLSKFSYIVWKCFLIFKCRTHF